MGKRLLICFAHPDDESFGMGGIITKLVEKGVEVYLICATNGDVGTIPDAMNGQYESVAELRLSELDCAVQKLNFKKVFTFGFKDSGMMGSDTSQDPASLWWTWNHEPANVTRRIVEVIRDVRPQVIVTFNRYGGYGHPDHIAMNQATCSAWDIANDASYVTNSLPYQPQKLYFTSSSKGMVRWRIINALLKGRNPRKVGNNKDIDLLKILEHIEPIHAKIDLRDYLEAWDEANICHKSQLRGRFVTLPMWYRKRFMSQQGYTRVYPTPIHNKVDESDLFENVAVDGG